MGVLDTTTTTQTETTAVTPRKKSTILPFLGVILLLGLAIGGSIFVVKTKPELLGLSKSNADASKEAESLVAKVGKIIELPRGEVPTVATVSDPSQTQNRQFFKNAEEGDKVLVYRESKRAFLYRPSENKIIEVGAVSLPSPTGVVAGEQTEIEVVTPTPLEDENPSPTSRPGSQSPTATPSVNP